MTSGVRRQDAALDCAGTTALPRGFDASQPNQSGDASPHSKDWPHAPVHRLNDAGIYMVTAGTYRKLHHLNSPDRLELVMRRLFECAEEFGWELHAWAILANHYHFLAACPDDPSTLRRLLGKLHMTTAKELNRQDQTPGRKVWYQYWDTHITYQPSYLARLKYVSHNPVRHGVVALATGYRWCSAAWFGQKASPAFAKTVNSLKTDRLSVRDDF